ncbi:hypothetical protein JOM56_008328 [Amanita muscaria]
MCTELSLKSFTFSYVFQQHCNILMPLGEVPITSYFPRLAKGKGKQSIRSAKRQHKKTNASVAESTGVTANVLARTDPPGPSKKRSRKNTSCSLSSASSGSLPPAYDIFHTKSRKAKKTRSDGIDKTCSVISLDDSDSDMHTKNDAGISFSTSDGRCLGPLSLNSVKGKGTPNEIQRLQQPEPSALRPFVTSSKSRLKLPDGTTKRRPCSDALHGSSSSSPGRDSRLIQNLSDGEHEGVVLSSQAFERQEEHLRVPYSTGEGGVAGADTDYNDVFTGILEDRFLPRNHGQNAVHRVLDDTQLEIIKSSQTQNILFDYVSPRRDRTSKRFRVPDPLPSLSMTEDSVETFVRSSQSQSEVGLSQLSQFGLDRRPECISDHSSPLDAPRSSSYREREGSKSQPPVRTYSDGLFSVPRRDSSTELCAQDPPMRDSCLNKTTTERNGPTVQEDSETEPDTDDDMLDPCTMKDNSRQELSNASSNEASNGFSESHSSDDNYTSLPEVVEEFRAMFGSDESYPPDFPSSLRQ